MPFTAAGRDRRLRGHHFGRASAPWPAGFGGAGPRSYTRALNRRAFIREAKRYVPELRYRDVVPARSGVLARAVARSGQLVDDFPNLEIRGCGGYSKRFHPKMLSNSQEVRARGPDMIAVASEGDEEIAAFADGRVAGHGVGPVWYVSGR